MKNSINSLLDELENDLDSLRQRIDALDLCDSDYEKVMEEIDAKLNMVKKKVDEVRKFIDGLYFWLSNPLVSMALHIKNISKLSE